MKPSSATAAAKPRTRAAAKPLPPAAQEEKQQPHDAAMPPRTRGSRSNFAAAAAASTPSPPPLPAAAAAASSPAAPAASASASKRRKRRAAANLKKDGGGGHESSSAAVASASVAAPASASSSAAAAAASVAGAAAVLLPVCLACQTRHAVIHGPCPAAADDDDGEEVWADYEDHAPFAPPEAMLSMAQIRESARMLYRSKLFKEHNELSDADINFLLQLRPPEQWPQELRDKPLFCLVKTAVGQGADNARQAAAPWFGVTFEGGKGQPIMELSGGDVPVGRILLLAHGVQLPLAPDHPNFPHLLLSRLCHTLGVLNKHNVNICQLRMELCTESVTRHGCGAMYEALMELEDASAPAHDSDQKTAQ